jgi:hypothetical protein
VERHKQKHDFISDPDDSADGEEFAVTFVILEQEEEDKGGGPDIDNYDQLTDQLQHSKSTAAYM